MARGRPKKAISYGAEAVLPSPAAQGRHGEAGASAHSSAANCSYPEQVLGRTDSTWGISQRLHHGGDWQQDGR